ncbi:unnamed protein product [Pylaiella littoralis]
MEKLIDSLLSSADAEAFREPVDWRGLGLDDYPTVIKRPMDLGTVKLRLERGAYPTAEACAADVRLVWENCRAYNTGGVPVKLHKAADNLSKRFEARFAKMPAGGRLKPPAKGIGGGGSSGRKGSARTKGSGGGGGSSKSGGAADVAAAAAPTSEDRRRLARHLGRARMEDVTAAVHEIDRLSPQALVLRRARHGEGERDRDDGGGNGRGADGAGTMTGSAPIEIEIDVDALDPCTFCAVERLVAPLSALRRASREPVMRRRTEKKRPAAATVAAAYVAGSSSNGRSGSGSSKKMAGSKSSGNKIAGGSRHQNHRQEERAGASGGAAAGEVRVKGGRGDRCSTAGVAAGAGAVEDRPCKKVKASTGAGGASSKRKGAGKQAEECSSQLTRSPA